MVKLKGPLFSAGASGSIDKRITYSKRKSGSQARFQKAQLDLNTTDQQAERAFFTEAIAAWHILSDADKLAWHNFNKG